MIRHAVKSMSAAAVLALGVAAPAAACNQPPSATSQQTQPQAQQVHAKFAYRGYGRRWHHHHRWWNRQNQPQAPSSSQQPAQAQQQSTQGGNCDHSGWNQ